MYGRSKWLRSCWPLALLTRPVVIYVSLWGVFQCDLGTPLESAAIVHTYNTVFSVRAMVHLQRLALLHIQSRSSHRYH